MKRKHGGDSQVENAAPKDVLDGMTEGTQPLSCFTPERVLRHDVWGRTISILGQFQSSDDAKSQQMGIVIIKEKGLELESVVKVVGNSRGGLEPGPLLTALGLGAGVTTKDTSGEPTFTLTLRNNEYGYFSCPRTGEMGGKLTVEVICPATWWHVGKYEKKQVNTYNEWFHCVTGPESQVMLLEETPQLYEELTVPYIAGLPPKKMQWL
jgi:hypothetical protein